MSQTLYGRLMQAVNRRCGTLIDTDPAAHLDALASLLEVVQAEERTAQHALYEARLTDVLCCKCGARVINEPDYLRLRLCVMCRACGCMAYCATCGESYPEHNPGGRGCATWQDPVPPRHVTIRAGIPAGEEDLSA
jgi:hypothetical protein